MTFPQPRQTAGYPPAGAPGGFGGPSAGGFGSPPPGFGGPPPGGFGGPPPGGFGGPPPGFGGPPGPYGPAPGGFGYGGPPPKGPNVGLIIGIVVGVLVLLGAVTAGVLLLAVRRAAPTAWAPTVERTPGSDGSGDSQPSPGAEATITLRDARLFKDGRTASLLHLVGELYNPGDSAVGFPQAKITLYDAAHTAVGSGYCTTVARVLPQHENIPCYAVFTDVKSYKTFEIEIHSSSTLGTHLADVSASDIEYGAPVRSYDPHTLSGKITNTGATTAKSVWAIVGLYDKDGKICGVGSTPVAGNDLGPGASGAFKVSIYSVAAPVTRYVVTPVGYE
jgi:hypothetical protein